MKKQMRIAATLAAGVLVCGALLFSGCEKDGANNSGKIDCYSINGQMYQTWTQKVYEYKSESGEVIYTDTYLTYYWYDYNDEGTAYDTIEKENTISVYKNRYTEKYTTYTFSKFVGWVTVERNYYFDVNAKTLDREIKFSEYKYEKNPDADSENKKENVDNKAAYNAIKKYGYYCFYESWNYSSPLGISKGSNGQVGKDTIANPASIRLDLAENGISRHEYKIFSESDTIMYRAKWF